MTNDHGDEAVNPILAAATELADAGVCVIPVRPDGSKAPDVAWRQYQHNRPDTATLAQWFAGGRYDGLGFVAGQISGGLEMLEVEGRALDHVAELVTLYHDHGMADLWARIATGYVIGTPSGGIHWHYRVSDAPAIGNVKLARRPATDAELADSERAILAEHPGRNMPPRVLIETRGEGGFSVTAPSNGRTHETGRPWRLITGHPATIPTITADDRDALHAIARMLDRMPTATAEAIPGPTGTGPTGEGRPGDDYNARSAWADVIGSHGWVQVGTYAGSTTWRRPGKDHGISATTGRTDADCLYVFSSSTVFETERPYTKFGAYAVLEHGGDHGQAARALRAAGYGSDTTASPGLTFDRSTGGGEHQAQEQRGGNDQADDAEPVDDGSDGMSDSHLARRVAVAALDRRYCWGRGLGWMAYAGGRWQRVDDKAARDEVSAWLLAQYRAATADLATAQQVKVRLDGQLLTAQGEAKTGDDPDTDALTRKIGQAKKQIETCVNQVKTWYGTLSRNKVSAITELAAGRLLCDAGDFDQHPDLLNTPNGVVDLRTGDLGPHDPDLLLTRSTAVDYVPDARHDDWDAALTAIPDDVRDWVQTRYGQAITGHMTPDDVLLIQQGGGENGKTTITAGTSSALGDYYQLISQRLLLANPGDHPTEQMDLRGSRFALIEETPEERRLNVTRLKATVGTPEITARYIRQDSVTFPATHSLVLSTNYKPVVEETDHGTWRRLALLVYPYSFVKGDGPLRGPHERRGDPTLRDRVTAGLSGQHEAVLAWLVDGAKRWYEAGRVMPPQPERVTRDTAVWRSESDLVLGYIGDRLVFDPEGCVVATELLADFNGWLAEHGHKPFGNRGFNGRFGGHSEVALRSVERKKVMRSEGLSRPPGVFEYEQPSPRNAFWSWLGVRFKTGQDE